MPQKRSGKQSRRFSAARIMGEAAIARPIRSSRAIASKSTSAYRRSKVSRIWTWGFARISKKCGGAKNHKILQAICPPKNVDKCRKREDHPWQPIRKINVNTRIVLAPYPMEQIIAVPSVQRSRACRISTVNAGMQSAQAIQRNRRKSVVYGELLE